MRVKCLAQEHKKIPLAKAQAQSARSRVGCANHEATTPSTNSIITTLTSDDIDQEYRSPLSAVIGSKIRTATANMLADNGA